MKQQAKKIFGIGLFMLTLSSVSTAQHTVKGTLSIAFEHTINGQPLLLDSGQYTTATGQSFMVTKLKYYVSNIALKKNDGAQVPLPGYYLIDEEESISKKITLTGIPAGDYSSISFIIGVDSLHNCSGAQSGALDPVNGMFWAWNTGYIFFKLEGKSASSASPGHIFEYHIGGYREPANCIRSISLSPVQALIITPQKNTSITLQADLSALFNGNTPVDISKLSSVTDFHNATMIADNYKDMFTISAGK